MEFSWAQLCAVLTQVTDVDDLNRLRKLSVEWDVAAKQCVAEISACRDLTVDDIKDLAGLRTVRRPIIATSSIQIREASRYPDSLEIIYQGSESEKAILATLQLLTEKRFIKLHVHNAFFNIFLENGWFYYNVEKHEPQLLSKVVALIKQIPFEGVIVSQAYSMPLLTALRKARKVAFTGQLSQQTTNAIVNLLTDGQIETIACFNCDQEGAGSQLLTHIGYDLQKVPSVREYLVPTAASDVPLARKIFPQLNAIVIASGANPESVQRAIDVETSAFAVDGRQERISTIQQLEKRLQQERLAKEQAAIRLVQVQARYPDLTITSI
jgi:hypothetical protein